MMNLALFVLVLQQAALVEPAGATASAESLVAHGLAVIHLEAPDELGPRLAQRLSQHGVWAQLETQEPRDVVADVRVRTRGDALEIVMVDAKHPRAFVRTVPYDGSASAVAIEEASLIIAQSVLAIRDGRPVPNATLQEREPMPAETPATAGVEPEPTPAPELDEAPRVKTNFPYGGYFGTLLGLSRVTEWAGPWLGYTFGLEGGYVFGAFRKHDGLRIGLGLSVESLSLHEFEFYSGIAQMLAKLRVGFARGPAWMYALATGGPAVYVPSYETAGGRPSVSTTLAGQLGLGVAFRVHRRMSLGIEGTAAGTLFGTAVFGGQLTVTGYFGRSVEKR